MRPILSAAHLRLAHLARCLKSVVHQRGGSAATHTREIPDVMFCEPACNSDQVRGETGVQN
jgi:hypothetical protein